METPFVGQFEMANWLVFNRKSPYMAHKAVIGENFSWKRFFFH